jgi:hypothetical protein
MSEENNAPVSDNQGAEASVDADISAEDLQNLVGEEQVEGEGAAAASLNESGGEESLSQTAKDEIADAEQDLADAKSSKQKQAAEKKLEKVKKKYNLKVDGEEFEWEGTDEDIVRELQLSRKARKDIQTAKEYQKEVQSLVQLLKENPAAVLSDPAIGIDVKEFAQQIINEQLEQEMKSPEQIEAERQQKELEELRAKIKEEEELRKKVEYEREVERQEADIQEKFIQALDESDMPNSPYLVKRMADVMLTGVNHGKNITPKQALNIVRKEMRKDLSDMFAASKEDLLEELLGSDTVKRFNKYQLGKYKKSQSVPSTKNIKDVGVSKREEKEQKDPKADKIKISDWLYSK